MIAIDLAPLMALERGEHVFETGLTYDGLTSLRIRVIKREGRLEFSDDGGAVSAACVDHAQFAFDDEIVMGEYSVNVSRAGVVSLPGHTTAEPTWLALLPRLVADDSLLLYESLLALED
jgi:hypothetical protein